MLHKTACRLYRPLRGPCHGSRSGREAAGPLASALPQLSHFCLTSHKPTPPGAAPRLRLKPLSASASVQTPEYFGIVYYLPPGVATRPLLVPNTPVVN